MRYSALFAGVVAAVLAASAPASAATYIFDSVGDSFTIDFNGFDGTTNIPGLGAEITYTLTALSNSSATFSYVLDNTSSGQVTAARVTTFGFNVGPSFSSVDVDSPVFAKVSSGNVPNGLPDVNFCLSAGSNCSGGGGGGEAIGAADATGSFTFTFAQPTSSVDLSDLYVRYQGVSDPTLHISGVSATGIAVPEPLSWTLMILGFGGVGAVMRSRRRAPAAA